MTCTLVKPSAKSGYYFTNLPRHKLVDRVILKKWPLVVQMLLYFGKTEWNNHWQDL